VDHAIDLIIGGFFFACKICEVAKTPKPGLTKRLKLRNIVFRDANLTVIAHDEDILLAEFVTLVFEDQKNGKRLERRTQRRTSDPSLCPVLRLGRAVLRTLRFWIGANANTCLCVTSSNEVRSDFVTSELTLQIIRQTCIQNNSVEEFGFDQTEVGNKSIRSAATMALFMKNTHPTRIMILGRWRSTTFLEYIRAQTLEWTSNKSEVMISFDHFTDLCDPKDIADHDPYFKEYNKDRSRNMRIPRALLDF